MTLLEAALAYATQGLYVFPIHGITNAGACDCGKDCESPGKHPRTSDGFRSATTDANTIKSWWTRWPNANIAIRTGAESGIIVLDVDGPEGEAFLKGKPLPPTPTAKTGRGRHICFKHPGKTVRNAVKIGPALDVRGDGGYIVAPPSKHKSGAVYSWFEALSLEETPLAAVPEWLLGLIQSKTASPAAAGQSAGADDAIPEGKRNATLTKLAGKLRRDSLGEEAIHAALLAENVRRCSPPLNDSEVRAIAASIAKKPAGAIAGKEKSRWVQFWDSPGLVDIVRDKDALRFLVLENGQPALRDKLAVQGEEVVPPSDLLYDAPTVKCLDYLQEQDRVLFVDVVNFIYDHVQTPQDSEIERRVLAAWVFHTYSLEKFQATPYLYFKGAFGSGKTRANATLQNVARHGLSTVGLTGAALFRVSEYYRPSFFVDELHLSKDASDIKDLLNARYKRGTKIVRINTDRKGLDQVEAFEVFGATGISTTAGLPQTLESRSLIFPMLDNSRKVRDHIDLAAAAVLRDRLTAFRARHLLGTLPMTTRQPYGGRLREIMTPLHQVLLLACPDAEADFVKYVLCSGAEQKAELQGSLDCEVVRALHDAEPALGDGVVEVSFVVDAVNAGRKDSEKVDSGSVGRCLKKLGFNPVPRHGAARARYVPQDRLDRLAVKYGLMEPSANPSLPSQVSQNNPARGNPSDEDLPTARNGTDGTHGTDSGGVEPVFAFQDHAFMADVARISGGA